MSKVIKASDIKEMIAQEVQVQMEKQAGSRYSVLWHSSKTLKFTAYPLPDMDLIDVENYYDNEDQDDFIEPSYFDLFCWSDALRLKKELNNLIKWMNKQTTKHRSGVTFSIDTYR